MAEFIREFVFQEATQLLAEISPWTAQSDLSGYIFRGHSDDSYKLVPTALRSETFWKICGGRPVDSQVDLESLQCGQEYMLLRQFYKTADRRGLNVPHIADIRRNLSHEIDVKGHLLLRRWIPDELLELASLAQHYGIPTRLLDWTYDPFVAAYFAAASSKTDKELSIWALDTRVIHDWEISGRSVPISLVTPPYAGNPNLAAQSGIFTSWAIDLIPLLNSFSFWQMIDRTPLDELLEHFATSQEQSLVRPMFLKFKLPGNKGFDVLQMLRQADYGAARIFPGYHGVAKEVLDSRRP